MLIPNLCQFSQQRCMGLAAEMELIKVEFFVRGMDTVVMEPKADQQRIDPEHIFEVGYDRDGGSFTDKHGGAA